MFTEKRLVQLFDNAPSPTESTNNENEQPQDLETSGEALSTLSDNFKNVDRDIKILENTLQTLGLSDDEVAVVTGPLRTLQTNADNLFNNRFYTGLRGDDSNGRGALNPSYISLAEISRNPRLLEDNVPNLEQSVQRRVTELADALTKIRTATEQIDSNTALYTNTRTNIAEAKELVANETNLKLRATISNACDEFFAECNLRYGNTAITQSNDLQDLNSGVPRFKDAIQTYKNHQKRLDGEKTETHPSITQFAAPAEKRMLETFNAAKTNFFDNDSTQAFNQNFDEINNIVTQTVADMQLYKSTRDQIQTGLTNLPATLPNLANARTALLDLTNRLDGQTATTYAETGDNTELVGMAEIAANAVQNIPQLGSIITSIQQEQSELQVKIEAAEANGELPVNLQIVKQEIVDELLAAKTRLNELLSGPNIYEATYIRETYDPLIDAMFSLRTQNEYLKNYKFTAIDNYINGPHGDGNIRGNLNIAGSDEVNISSVEKWQEIAYGHFTVNRGPLIIRDITGAATRETLASGTEIYGQGDVRTFTNNGQPINYVLVGTSNDGSTEPLGYVAVRLLSQLERPLNSTTDTTFPQT